MPTRFVLFDARPAGLLFRHWSAPATCLPAQVRARLACLRNIISGKGWPPLIWTRADGYQLGAEPTAMQAYERAVLTEKLTEFRRFITGTVAPTPRPTLATSGSGTLSPGSTPSSPLSISSSLPDHRDRSPAASDRADRSLNARRKPPPAAGAIALPGQPIAKSATLVLGWVAQRVSPAAGFLAAQNTRTNAHRLAAVITPLSLAVAMASTILFTQTTSSHAAGEQAGSGTKAPYVLAASGPGVPSVVAETVRERVPGMTATEVIRTTVRIRQDKFPAQGLSSRGLSRTLDPEVTSGTLAAMNGDTVALSSLAARTRNAQVGERVTVTLGDGVKKDLKVSAIYERGLGFGDLLLSHQLVAAHVDNPLSSSVLVAGAPSAEELAAALSGFPAVHVLDRADVEAARRTQGGAQAQVNYIAMGLIIAFTGIAVVNTLVMATSARRREFALLRMIGTTGRQLRAMLRWETLTVSLPAIVLGTTVAYATLTAYSLGMTGTATPDVPTLTYLSVIATATALAFLSTALPARAAQRGAAVSLGGRE